MSHDHVSNQLCHVLSCQTCLIESWKTYMSKSCHTHALVMPYTYGMSHMWMSHATDACQLDWWCMQNEFLGLFVSTLLLVPLYFFLSPLWRVSENWESWRSHVCDMTNSNLWHDIDICVTRLIFTFDMIYQRIYTCDMTFFFRTWLTHAEIWKWQLTRIYSTVYICAHLRLWQTHRRIMLHTW